MTETEALALVFALVGLSWNRDSIGEVWQLLGLALQLLAVAIMATAIILNRIG